MERVCTAVDSPWRWRRRATEFCVLERSEWALRLLGAADVGRSQIDVRVAAFGRQQRGTVL